MYLDSMGIQRSIRWASFETDCGFLCITNIPTIKTSTVCCLLTPLIGNTESAVRDLADFLVLTKEWTTRKNHRMASFDVASLFTNVPKDLATEVVKKALKEDDELKERTDLMISEILILLRLCLDATYFTLQNVIYK